jgi:hypothetical protein
MVDIVIQRAITGMAALEKSVRVDDDRAGCKHIAAEVVFHCVKA